MAAGCGPKPDANTAGVEACPDDGPRLPETGICEGRAVAYLNVAEGARTPALPDGCEWAVNEAVFADQALLYRAARCNGVTTKLSASPGAHQVEVKWETSAVFDASDSEQVLIHLFTSGPPNPQFALTDSMSALPAAERSSCEVRPAGIEGWPADALVIAPNAAARARLPNDGPISACGPMGLDEDSQRYWRISQGYAWFFDLGQEEPDFDPGSVTVLVRDADGSWSAKP
ncbi:MAG: hypothetical protein WDM79_05865 [Terricaulis sp.]